MLEGKKILVGVSGGIAAYKAAELVSRLRKQGAEVHVVMTQAATEFITPLTLRTLANNPVHVEMFAEPKLWNVEHIALAQNADVIVIAPATANIIAKMAAGLADDLLSSVLLASPAPIFIAPAMNHGMYHHPATQANLQCLKGRGVNFIGPANGFQACGTDGDGRMSEPAEIVEALNRYFVSRSRLKGKKVIVTAGGTQEPLDPVRYLGNDSSGRMGYAIAQAFQEAGAHTLLVSAPTHLEVPAGVEQIEVRTALQMREAVLEHYAGADVVVKSAAVADYRPAHPKMQKIKKNGENLTLELIPNPDILAELGKEKTHQILVGFAAETENPIESGREKLKRKNADMLVVNDVTLPGAGFGSPTNIVTFLFPDGRRVDLPQLEKLEIGRQIVEEVENILISGKEKNE